MASTPPMVGMRRSISTTSGDSRAAWSRACSPSEASPTTVEARFAVEDAAQAVADDGVVVDDQEADDMGGGRIRHIAPPGTAGETVVGSGIAALMAVPVAGFALDRPGVPPIWVRRVRMADRP